MALRFVGHRDTARPDRVDGVGDAEGIADVDIIVIRFIFEDEGQNAVVNQVVLVNSRK